MAEWGGWEGMKKPSSSSRRASKVTAGRKRAAKSRSASRGKAKKQAKPLNIEPAWTSPPAEPVVLRPAPDVVLIAVPVEKTKTTVWQQFVDWLRS